MTKNLFNETEWHKWGDLYIFIDPFTATNLNFTPRTMSTQKSTIRRIYDFYADGFKTLSPWARNMWAIILIKLFIMFVIFKLFFFRDTLKNRFPTDQERSNHVIEQITTPKNHHNNGAH